MLLSHHSLMESSFYPVSISHREPDLCNDTLLGDVDVTAVQDVVDGLDLLHLDPPGPQVGCCLMQQSLAVGLGLCHDLQAQHGATLKTGKHRGHDLLSQLERAGGRGLMKRNYLYECVGEQRVQVWTQHHSTPGAQCCSPRTLPAWS